MATIEVLVHSQTSEVKEAQSHKLRKIIRRDYVNTSGHKLN